MGDVTVLLSGAKNSALAPLAQQLEQAGLNGQAGQLEPVDPARLSGEAWESRLKSGEQHHGLLLYSDPIRVIAPRLAQDADPAEAVADWVEQTRPVLEAHRRIRARSLVVEQTAALDSPGDLMGELNRRLGIALRPIAGSQAAPAQDEPDPVHLLLADSALRQNVAARRMAAELEASSLPLPVANGQALNLSVAVKTYRQTHRQTGDLASQNQQLEQEIKRLKAKPAKAVDEAQLKDLKEENDLLLQQLHHVQEELERYYLDNQQLQSGGFETQKMRKRISDLERRVRYFENSKSWKITAPLRAVLKLFKRS